MRTDQLTFGELLKHTRQAAGLTQEALAARAGLSARVISDLERNVNHAPRSTTVELIVSALSLSDLERRLFEATANSSITDVEACHAAPDQAATSATAGTAASELAVAPLVAAGGKSPGRRSRTARFARHVPASWPGRRA
ncbi:MAG: helix-turn-helix domain-containing protein [Chloroflexi bacterium]|nr:helix-turn-helix domain-containing protein [Chloroflexota bacterium]